MSRAWLVVFGYCSVSICVGCSGDASGGDGRKASGGSAQSGAGGGSNGGGGNAGLGGSAQSGAGGGSPTYTAARACELLARASCNKGLECGLVLGQAGDTLICVQCDAVSLGVIEQACQQDSPTDKPVAAVDRCVANISGEACERACTEFNVDGCDVFGELGGGTNPLVCDPRCAE